MSPTSRTRNARAVYRVEQRSLESAFAELDANVIAEVLVRRRGNVDLAAQDLLEIRPSSTEKRRRKAEAPATEREYWGDVLAERRADAERTGTESDGSASNDNAATRSEERSIRSRHEWPSEQWGRESDDSTRFADVERICGWRNGSAGETELLLKWRGTSYANCTWAKTSAIERDVASGTHGKMRVTRYFDKHPIELGPRVDVRPEYLVVERVFSKFEGVDKTLMCVKWQRLGYDETTWEEQSAVRDLFEGGSAAIERFERVRSRATSAFARQAIIERETANDVNNAWSSYDDDAVCESYGESSELRSYQKEGVKWMSFNFRAGRGCILADEMGLGKTAQSLALIHHCLKVRPGLPALIVVPLSTVVNWEREAKRWVPDAYLVTHIGKQAGRDFAREHDWYHAPVEGADGSLRSMKADIVLTTYETVTADRQSFAKVKWCTMVVDEAHRLKRIGGKLGNDLGTLSVERICLLTGTPLQNNTAELWSLLNFVDSKHFSDAEDFEAAFGGMVKASQVERLQQVLGPYLLRRLKSDVEQKLPPRSETLVECELAPLQKKCYRALFERNFSFLRQGCESKENFANFANIMMEVRKCCQHPFLLDGVEAAVAPEGASTNILVSSSGKLQLLDKLLPHLREGGHRALVFSQMTRVLDVLEDYCRARGHSYVRLDGSVTGSARQEAIDHYCAEDSDTFLFLLSTRAGGQGINLVQADTVIMFDSDWNPQNDAQALARAHRIGQTRQVQVYRLVMRGSYEKEMFTRASMKLGLEQAIFGGADKEEKTTAQSRKEIEALLKHGAYGIFAEDEARAQQWSDDSIVDILARSEQKLIKGAEETNEVGPSTFATATFVDSGMRADGVSLDDPNFWQKLMPEAAAAEEERKAEAEELLAKMQAAEKLAEEKKNAVNAFHWSWGERKRVVASFMLFGWGMWEPIRARSQLKDDKTIAHVKMFCRCYVEDALKTVPSDLVPNIIEVLTTEEDEDENSLPDSEGREYLKYIMAEQGFNNFVRGRASDDLARLELLQGGIKAVTKAGSFENALTAEGMPIPELFADPVASWWTEDHDRALVVGTLKHGFGKYAEIRDDPSLPFAETFAGKNAPEPVKKDKKKEYDVVAVDTVDAEKPIEWIHGRLLSMRTKRIFSALGGTSFEPPPKIERTARKSKTAKFPREKKPKGAPRSGSGATMEKLEKAQEFLKELKRDACGQLAMPVGPISGVTIECLGAVHNKNDFVSQQYILPVGFKSSRMYPRLDNLDERTRWEQKITKSPKGEPQFTLTAEEGCEPIVAKSATAAWAEVLKRAKAAREARGEVPKKTAISGPEFFGYSLPHVRLMIESLPRVSECKGYVMYADSCAKTVERKKKEEAAMTHPSAGDDKPVANDDVDLSQGYETIDIE